MADNKKILVGKIVAPQGIRGEVRVHAFTDKPLDIKNLPIESEKFAVGDFGFVRVVPNTNVVIAKINGVNDRNVAETLRGVSLYVERDALPQLGDNEYYQADLIGFDVVRGGKKMGVVDCFQNFGAGDIIEMDNGEMVSFAGAIVNMEVRTVYVK